MAHRKLTPFYHAIRAEAAKAKRLSDGADSQLAKEAEAFLSSKDFKNKAKLPEVFLNKVKPALLGILNNNDAPRQVAKANIVAQLETIFNDLATSPQTPDALKGQLAQLNQQLNPANGAAVNKAAILHGFLQNNLVSQSPLLAAATEGLSEYLAENMGNFERMVHNLDKTTTSILTTQAMHAAYLQGWERVGFMLGNIVLAVSECVLADRQGAKLKIDLDDESGNRPNIVPIKM